MKSFIIFFILGCLTIGIPAPPVTQKKPGDNDVEKDSDIKENMEDYMEYHRYLKEIVAALESDPEFREKLEKADYVDIRTGKIAHELDFVNHNIRSKLDEIKRKELERLLHLTKKQHELVNNIDSEHLKISTHEHLDHNNPHTFEIDDLKKLILKTTKDLEEADKKRRTEFKEYEMQKEFEKNQKIQTLDEDHRKEYEKAVHEQEEKHKKHEPLHHPGSRQQLEEVWEKQDHMENQQFDPKVFFMFHDVDGNGVWDQNEVKALFLKELDKMYQNGVPEDDMRERQEEMERMREHIFHESDTNKDGVINYEEFLIQTRRPEFEQDQGWKGLDEQEIYTAQEYQEFERNRLEEVQRLIQQGVLPPQPNYSPDHQYPHGNSHPGIPQQYPPQQQYGQPQQYHPNAIPQGQQQYHPNAPPPQGHQQFQQNPQYYPNSPPQGPQQYNPNAPPHYQQPNAAPPNQQYNPNSQGQVQYQGQQGPNSQQQQYSPPNSAQPGAPQYQQPNPPQTQQPIPPQPQQPIPQQPQQPIPQQAQQPKVDAQPLQNGAQSTSSQKSHEGDDHGNSRSIHH